MPKKSEEAVEAEIVNKEKASSKLDEGNRSGVFWGLVLIALGGILVAETFTDINLWQYFWPGVLIVLGLSLVLRSYKY